MRPHRFGGMKMPDTFQHSPSALTGDESSRDYYDPDYWAQIIGASMRHTVESIIETGGLFMKAKANLAHGQFTTMVEQKLKMTVRMAEKYMAVARDRTLANPKHASGLPAAVDTLALMTSIPDSVLQEKLADGTITPKLRRKDVAKLKGTEEKRRKATLSLADKIKQKDHEIEDLKEKLAAAETKDGSLFDLKKDSIDHIVTVIVQTVSPHKAKEIAAGIAAHLKKSKSKPAG
jgi:hypothetical protein